MATVTGLLCMLRSEGMYRTKWASAVKRAFNHIPIIDDIIEVTKTQRKASEVSTTVTLLAEIILITTSRQATRMFFPLAFLVRAVAEKTTIPDKQYILHHFNTTGSGGFALYKKACEHKWYINGSFLEEEGGQVVFHCIFGTYKEDFGTLASITDTENWFTREELGKKFCRGTLMQARCHAKLPKLRVYSKMSCANQSGLLTGVYNQVASVPSMSGKHEHLFTGDFFEHLERKNTVISTGKTLTQINASLSRILEDLHIKLRAGKGRITMGTVDWRTTEGLDFGVPGDITDFSPVQTGQYFMGKIVRK